MGVSPVFSVAPVTGETLVPLLWPTAEVSLQLCGCDQIDWSFLVLRWHVVCRERFEGILNSEHRQLIRMLIGSGKHLALFNELLNR